MWINAWRWKTRFVSAGFPALILGLLGGWIGSLVSPGVSRTWGQEVTWQLRDQVPTGSEGSAFRPRFRDVSWEPSQTAIIVCDVWDAHHCLNAVRRLNEMVPRLNQVLEQGREQGMLIIHAPSDCMPAYADHPARQRAETIPGLDRAPSFSPQWCAQLPAEEAAVYPIDQSDGGEDDDPLEHQQWVETLKQQGRNPATPWLRQHPAIAIDSQRDYITDRGDEVWAILEARGIQHVILTGVHTNMCVLGRPFGLRQMVRQGRDVVLMRDLTDTMYNPQRWPYVDHFTGTDRIIEHIERFVCGTVTSAQVLGGKPFRYSTDDRIRLAVLLGEGLYDTASTLPEFAAANLGRDFQVMWIVADDKAAGEWVGFESLQDADAALISVRRRSLTEKQLQILRDFVAQGKPMIGLRTASHAFDVRGEVPVGRAVWPEFDAEVWGGNYHNHYSDDLASTVTRLDAAESHPILAGVPDRPLLQGGSLYRTSPLNPAAVPLLEGTVSGEAPEPVAWTFIRADGGRSFYASLGHPDDFAQAAWVDLLTRAIYHTVGRDVPADYRPIVRGEDLRPWPTVKIPASAEETLSDSAWYRAVIQISREEPSEEPWEVELPEASDVAIWIDGHRLQPATASGMTRWTIPPEILKVNQPQFWAIRVLEPKPPGFPRQAARLVRGPETWVLAGTWQTRRVSAESAHDTAGFENLPLPAQFGGGSDIVLRLDPLTD